jgi:type 1 glutamine amidotransferase
MIRPTLRTIFLLAICTASAFSQAEQSSLHVLAFYSTNVEHDHVAFAEQAVRFFADTARKNKVDFQSTTDWNDLNAIRLQHVQLVLWLNDLPQTDRQRDVFQQYMENGGAWLGFHFAAYNDADTHWPWFIHFLGGAVFYGNNWPPLPAVLDVDNRTSPVTRGLPSKFTSPANEWYSWQPNPRTNKDVSVLLTLDQSNYPLGFKDTLMAGDVPVVWTNTKYRMIYMNMGHGDKIFTNPQQNRLFENALLWLVKPKDNGQRTVARQQP